jgi:hypothetical protein
MKKLQIHFLLIDRRFNKTTNAATAPMTHTDIMIIMIKYISGISFLYPVMATHSSGYASEQ